MNENEAEKKRIATRIKTIRNELGLTMREFGEKFDPPASDSIVSRWERGVNLPNNERLKKIAELGNISTFYLSTGNKNINDLTEDERKNVFKGSNLNFKEENDEKRDYLKKEIKNILSNEMSFVEVTYLQSMLNFLKVANTEDVISIANIISSLVRYDSYKLNYTDTESKKELYSFLNEELEDIKKFFENYLLNDKEGD